MNAKTRRKPVADTRPKRACLQVSPESHERLVRIAKQDSYQINHLASRLIIEGVERLERIREAVTA